MQDKKEELQGMHERLKEILATDNWNKDECYEEGTWQDELSWEYGALIDDINELEKLLEE